MKRTKNCRGFLGNILKLFDCVKLQKKINKLENKIKELKDNNEFLLNENAMLKTSLRVKK